MTTREEIDTADHKGADVFFAALTSFWDLSGRKALDMFARDGVLTVKRYSDKVKELHLWELNGEHESALKAFNPKDVKIGCSYASMDAAIGAGDKWGFIVVDTPQGTYPAMGGVVAEHFSLMGRLPQIMEDDCVVAFYVNKKPYSREVVENYGRDEYAESYSYSKWMSLREAFYGLSKGEQLTEGQAVKAYSDVFEAAGFKVKHVLVTPCYDFADGLPPSFRCAMNLVR